MGSRRVVVFVAVQPAIVDESFQQPSDEFFESLTLIQTQRIKPFPIVLVGSSFWSGLIDWLKESFVENGTISETDLELFRIIDDPSEVVDYIKKTVIKII